MSQNFYHDLPVMDTFSDIFEERFFQEVPSDWWVVLTDVVGSTKAIEAGRYKDVNSAGSLSAMAIANIFGHMDFPFIFGGDGMTCLIPGESVAEVRPVLAGVGPVVRDAFDLELRLALVPVTILQAQGAQLKVGRWRVSEHYTQAIIEGDGVDVAEGLLKTPGSKWVLDSSQEPSTTPNLSGYSCRWQDFPSPLEETIALIVRFRNPNQRYFQNFLTVLDGFFGEMSTHHPLRAETHRPAFNAKRLNGEVGIRTGSTKGWDAWKFRMILRLQILWSLTCIAFKIHFKLIQKDVSELIQENVSSSDYKKYDNTLKMVVAVTKENREKLAAHLEKEYQAGEIFYGLHVTNRAMLTCLMHTRSGDEVHFVDAADGGYAFAAKQLKGQIKGAQAKA